MKVKIINLLLAFILILFSSWAFYESAKELQETIYCNSENYECIYSKGCPYFNPSYTEHFNLQEIFLERHKRLVRNSKGSLHTEVDSYIITQRKYIRVSYKIFIKVSEFKQNPIGSLFYQNYQIGVIPLCILFFILGLYYLINFKKKE